MTPMRAFLYYHLPVMVYAGAIIAVSSIPQLATPEMKILAFDKVAHFVEYAIFAFLIFRSISRFDRLPRRSLVPLISVLLVAVFALFDELYQKQVPGRQSDPYDYLADLSGALLVVGLLWIGYRRRHSRQTG